MAGPSNETEEEKRLERIAVALEAIAESLSTLEAIAESLESLASVVEPQQHYDHRGTVKAFLRTD